jgi:chromosomal replication initiator protein
MWITLQEPFFENWQGIMQNNVWNDVLRKLEKRINRPSFNTWLRPTCLVSAEEQKICIGVPDEVFVYWLGEYYVHVIADILVELLGVQPEISFVVMDEEEQREPEHAPAEQGHLFPNATPVIQPVSRPATDILSHRTSHRQDVQFAKPAAPPPKPQALPSQTPVKAPAAGQFATVADIVPSWPRKAAQKSEKDGSRVETPWHAGADPTPAVRASHQHFAGTDVSRSLNSRYTFDSYVVGSSNRFAHAAARAVAEQMTVNYNPLFIYGGVGLGKTHLLHAIGNQIAISRRTNQILYLSSEQFINELIGSIRQDRMASFRDKYRNIDLLLIDDIQFIARKERTQEEFFHTFNTLYHERKQIVLTSDCPPKKIPTIAEQLRSRFEWGLIADIQTPDLETRLAILKKKAEALQMLLSDDVALFIANNVKSNIRELEGCLSKLKAYASFGQQPVTIELARSVLRDLFDAMPRKVTVEVVQQAVANHYHIELESMTSQGRSRKVTLPRQIAMYLARELTNLSLPDIGRNFGGRDHSTVLHACRKVEKIQNTDLGIKKSLMQLREVIKV